MTPRNKRRITMRDVAAAVDVPVSSVALVLNGKPGVSAERREAVLEAARELGYEQPSQTRLPVVGLLVEDLGRDAKLDGFIDSIVHGVYSAARAIGLHVVLAVHHVGVDPVAELRSLTRGNVDGMILTNGGDISPTVVRRIVDTGVPVVLVENYVSDSVDAVIADNFTAGYVSTQHLLEQGHRRIGLLAGSGRYVSLTDRARGHVAALWEAGISPDRDLMPDQPAGAGQKGYAQTCLLLNLPEPPTAIYAVSDKSARGAYQAIEERGLRVGIDISVVGTDNVEESAFRSPPLTTFDVHAGVLGEEAVRVLARKMSGEKQQIRTTIPGELVIRESVGQLAQAEPAVSSLSARVVG